jgi:YfiH family protein
VHSNRTGSPDVSSVANSQNLNARAMTKPYLAPSLASAESVIAHGFFTRAGGTSGGIYDSLNCGLGSLDEPRNVERNRLRVAEHLGADHVSTCYQVHSPDVVVAERPWTRATMPRCDAIVTRVPGLAIGVLTADCAPVLFAEPDARIIGAAHAGWRGALEGVTDATIAKMVELGAKRDSIVAAVGPCIGVGAYEVGPEFEERFLAHHPANYQFFERPKRDGKLSAKPRFDLSAYVVTRLRLSRIARVDILDPCTFTNDSEFFSFRRSQARKEKDYGRQISAIVLR